MNATPPLPLGSPRNKSTARTLGWIAGAAIFAAMLVYLARSFSAAELRVEHLRFVPLALAFVLLAAAYFAQCVAWHRIVRASGSTTSLAIDAARWCLSLLGKYVPGKIWHGVGRVYLYRDKSAGIATTSTAFVVESLMSMAAAALVSFLSFASVESALPPVVPIALALVALSSIVIVMTPLFDLLAAMIVRRMLKQPLANTDTRGRLSPFAWQIAAYLLLGSGSFALGAAIEPLSWAMLPTFIGALCVSGLAGIVAFFVPAGLGVRDGAFAAMLGFVLPPSVAILVAIAVRLWLTIGDVAAVAVARAMLGRRADD